MRGQPVRRHIQHGPRQARRYHPPANRALRTTQNAKKEQTPGPACRDRAKRKKAQKPDGPNHTDKPPQLPVPPFPPVDKLELGQAHALVLQLIFRDRAVEIKLALPILCRHRGQGAGKGLPFGDGQPAIGQTCQPTDRDHHNHQRKQKHQPNADRAPCPTLARINHAALRFRCGLCLCSNLFKDAALAAHRRLL